MKWYNNLFVDRFNEMIGLILDSWQRFPEKISSAMRSREWNEAAATAEQWRFKWKTRRSHMAFLIREDIHTICNCSHSMPVILSNTHTHFRKTREQFEWNSKLWMRIIRIAWWICRCCHCNRDKNHLLNGRKKCTAEVWRVQFLMGELAQDHA